MMCTFSFFLFLWKIVGWCFRPFFPFLLKKRLKKNLEDHNHIQERYGIASLPPIKSEIIWIHAASVGETRAAFPLIEQFLEQSPTIILLITTATFTGKRTLEQHPAYQKRVFHQFIPYDIEPFNQKFLNYWKFSAAIFIENELWPGFLSLCHKKNIPLFLINGRISQKTFQKWLFLKSIFRALLKNFTLIIPRSLDDGRMFQAFAEFKFPLIGDLKEYAPPLQYNLKDYIFLQKYLKGRKIFVAASTHEGEEEIIIKAAQKLQIIFPSLLTILIPRHPERGQALHHIISAPLRSKGKLPLPSDSFWIIDTLGELGLFYHLTQHVFLGGSLMPAYKGHNPLEALHFGCSLATGPYLSNWLPLYKIYHDNITIFSQEQSFETQIMTWLQSPFFSTSPLAPQDNLPHKIVKHILNLRPQDNDIAPASFLESFNT